MTTRRGMMKGLGLVAGAVGSVGLAGPAHAQSAVRPRLADLARLPASAAPVWVEGQGWFESGPANGEADGVLRVAGPDGQHWMRGNASGVLRPHWFVEDGDDGDDARAIQRACDFAAAHGPFAIELGGNRYSCRSPLIVDPTCMVLRGVGAVLDFSAMPEPPEREPVVTAAQILPTGTWARDGGALVHSDGAPSALTHFLSLPDDGRYRISLIVSELSGTSDYPFVNVSVTAPDRSPLGGVRALGAGHYSFEVDGRQPAVRLVVESDGDARVESLSVEWHGRRECVLVQSGENSPQYGHKWIDGVEFTGPGEGTRLHGLRFETRAEARSSRLDLRNVVVQGFQTGLVFSHRSYLLRGYGLRCLSEIAMHFLGGSEDAGELFSFFGSIIGGAKVAILCNDAEILLSGTSIDFADQVFVGSGQLALHGCHLELNRPTAPDAAPFDLGSGSIVLSGGTFGVTGRDFEAGNQCDHIFRLRSRGATASMQDVATYNLRTRSGALAGGPGRLDVARLRGHRPRHTAPVVQFGSDRNLLGPLPQDLRTSDGPTGAFTHFPLQEDGFEVSPAYRFVWLCGQSRPGAAIGAAFEIKGDAVGRIAASVRAVRGDVRVAVGDRWMVDVTSDWGPFAANTGDAHPAAPGGGRMPDGCSEVALLLDLSGYAGTVYLRNVFLCAG